MAYLIILLSTLLLIMASIRLVDYLKEQLKDTSTLIQNIIIILFIVGLIILVWLPVHQFIDAQQRLNDLGPLSSSQNRYVFISNLLFISVLFVVNASFARAIFRKKYKVSSPKWIHRALNVLVLTSNLFFLGVLIYQYNDTKTRLKELEEINKSQILQK